MMKIVYSLIDKFIKRLNELQRAEKEIPDSSPDFVAIQQWIKVKHTDLKTSLATLRRSQNVGCLARFGLVEE